MREVGFGDKSIADNAGFKKLDRYTAEENRRDKIRVLSTCYAYKTHWLFDKGKGGFYFNCGKDEDGQGTCLACNATNGEGDPKYPVAEKYGSLIIHVSQKVRGKEWESVQKLKFWGFGNDKYQKLYELQEDFGDLKKTDLIVSCQDEQFQKLNFSPTNQDSEADPNAIREQLPLAKTGLKDYLKTPDMTDQTRAMGGGKKNVDTDIDQEVMDRVSGVDDGVAEDAAPAAGVNVADEVDDILGDL